MERDGVIEVRSPTVGTVTEVLVQLGVQVTHEDDLLILESMKIQIPIRAPRPGVIQNILVKVGDTVRRGDVLMVLSE